MKKLITITLLTAFLFAGTALKAQNQPQEYLGLPGDNLNLYAVMKLFQDSKTLEGFEKSLNEQNTRINNLDLNGDNYVDYIRVVDNIDGNIHYIVLQDMVSPDETQDVAVFTVQRFPDGEVQIQLTGDEDLYGKNYIIEPIYNDENMGTPNPGYIGNTETINGRTITIIRTTPMQIAAWPVIRFIYRPKYVIWRSRWYWGYYPAYWHPWRPDYWHYYYGFHNTWYNDYYSHYRRMNYHRNTHWNDYYYNTRRAHSPSVSVRINSGSYRNTYSHPEQRREGEAVFNKTYASQGRRSATSPTSYNQGRRSGTAPDRSGNSSVSTTTRRTTTTVKTGTVTGNRSDQNRGASRRSSTTVTTRQTSKPVTIQKTQSNRSSGKTVKESSSNRRSSGNNKTATGGKKESKTNKSETKSERRR